MFVCFCAFVDVVFPCVFLCVFVCVFVCFLVFIESLFHIFSLFLFCLSLLALMFFFHPKTRSFFFEFNSATSSGCERFLVLCVRVVSQIWWTINPYGLRPCEVEKYMCFALVHAHLRCARPNYACGQRFTRCVDKDLWQITRNTSELHIWVRVGYAIF